MKKFIQSFKKHPKSWLIVATVLVLGILTVMGTHFSDAAKTPFWWKFWIVASVVSGIVLVGGWAWAWASQKKDIE